MSQPFDSTLNYQTPPGTGWNASVRVRPIKGISLALRTVIVLSIMGLAIHILLLHSQVGLLTAVKGGAKISASFARANHLRVRVAYLFAMLMMLAGMVLWLIWFYRAYSNLPAFTGVSNKHANGWAVGAFFVPFLNLVRVPQMATEVLKGSDPEKSAGNGPVTGWWFFWIVAGVAYRVSAIVMEYPVQARVDINSLITGCWIIIAADATLILAGLFAIRLVSRISDWQLRGGEG